MQNVTGRKVCDKIFIGEKMFFFLFSKGQSIVYCQLYETRFALIFIFLQFHSNKKKNPDRFGLVLLTCKQGYLTRDITRVFFWNNAARLCGACCWQLSSLSLHRDKRLTSVETQGKVANNCCCYKREFRNGLFVFYRKDSRTFFTLWLGIWLAWRKGFKRIAHIQHEDSFNCFISDYSKHTCFF